MSSKKNNKQLKTIEMKIYSKKEMINYMENEIEECKEYYPIPNLFLGLNVEESLKLKNEYLDELEKILRDVKEGKFNEEYQKNL